MARSMPLALLTVSSYSSVGVGIGDDAGAGLDVGFAVLEQAGAQGDAGVVRAVEAEVADRAGVGAAFVFLQLVDDLHRADFRRAADGAGREGGAQHVVGAVRPGSSSPLDVARRCA